MPKRDHSKAERVRYWRDSALGDVEILHVDLRNHSFERHTHESFATSIIDKGAGSFWYRGETRYAPAGSVVLLDPEEAHTGEVTSSQTSPQTLLAMDAIRLAEAPNGRDRRRLRG